MISFTSAWSRTPCGFQTMSDNSLRNRTWAGSFKAPYRLCCLEFALGETVLFASMGDGLCVSTTALFRLHDAWWLPRTFTGRQNRRRRFLRPVETRDQVD